MSICRQFRERTVLTRRGLYNFGQTNVCNGQTTEFFRPLQLLPAFSDPNIFRTCVQRDKLERKQTHSLEINVSCTWEADRSFEDIWKPPILPSIKLPQKKREWLASAIQAHIQELTQHIIFRDSELPDQLLSETCITEDECEEIRKAPNRKNQMRILVQKIVGRDFEVLERFLKYIHSQNQSVYDAIKKTYKQNEESNLYENYCAVCRLEMYFEIEDVAEALWAQKLINEDLYRRVIRTDISASHTQLWKDLFRYINSLDLVKRQSAFLQLKEAVDRKQTYKYLSSAISECWNTYGNLRCICKNELELFMSGRSVSSTDTIYPKTSTSSPDISTSDVTEATRTTHLDIQSKKKVFTKVESVKKLRSTQHHLPKNVDDGKVSEAMHGPHFASFGAAKCSVNVLVPTKVDLSTYQMRDEPTDIGPKKGLVMEKVAHFEKLAKQKHHLHFKM